MKESNVSVVSHTYTSDNIKKFFLFPPGSVVVQVNTDGAAGC